MFFAFLFFFSSVSMILACVFSLEYSWGKGEIFETATLSRPVSSSAAGNRAHNGDCPWSMFSRPETILCPRRWVILLFSWQILKVDGRVCAGRTFIQILSNATRLFYIPQILPVKSIAYYFFHKLFYNSRFTNVNCLRIHMQTHLKFLTCLPVSTRSVPGKQISL